MNFIDFKVNLFIELLELWGFIFIGGLVIFIGFGLIHLSNRIVDNIFKGVVGTAAITTICRNITSGSDNSNNNSNNKDNDKESNKDKIKDNNSSNDVNSDNNNSNESDSDKSEVSNRSSN